MWYEVHVEHEAGSHIVQDTQTGGVARMVEVEDHITKLWLQFQILLESAANLILIMKLVTHTERGHNMFIQSATHYRQCKSI